MKTLKEHKEVLEGVLCMDAWGIFILGAIIAILWVHLENTQLMWRGLGITLVIWSVMWFYMTKHLEQKRIYIANKSFFTWKLQ